MPSPSSAPRTRFYITPSGATHTFFAANCLEEDTPVPAAATSLVPVHLLFSDAVVVGDEEAAHAESARSARQAAARVEAGRQARCVGACLQVAIPGHELLEARFMGYLADCVAAAGGNDAVWPTVAQHVQSQGKRRRVG